VYTSLTQLLIRRSVFDKIGLFRTDWGSEGDFEWGMRAALMCNVLHIPETLATWRIHAEQATTINASSARIAKFCEMIVTALKVLKERHPKYYKKNIRLHRLLFPYRRRYLNLTMQECHSKFGKLRLLLRFLLISPQAVKEFMNVRFRGIVPQKDDLTYIRQELKRQGLEGHIQVISEICEMNYEQ
jgi:hypothetical protein